MAKNQKTYSTESAETVTCANCGAEQSEWAGEGYTTGGQAYCCQGCAEDTGCTCGE